MYHNVSLHVVYVWELFMYHNVSLQVVYVWELFMHHNVLLQVVYVWELLSPAAPKARDGRYCNAPRLSVCPSVRPSHLVFAL